MAKCPFAEWRPIGGANPAFESPTFKIVHHTTEGSTAAGAMAAFAKNRSTPHFTVDRETIYQHVDTDQHARSLRNAEGGVQTNLDGAIQIELVGFAHLRKDPLALTNVARLCRWIETEHGIPIEWPAGLPRPAVNGKDPGGHLRDPAIWTAKRGHYGHCHVPENTHWDPAYSAEEVAFLDSARFDEGGGLVSATLPPPAPAQATGTFGAGHVSTMPDHCGGEGEPHDGPAPVEVPAGAAPRPERVLNARADTLDFRDLMYVPTLVEVPPSIALSAYKACEVPVLDQGREGACTGFGLATVANYLLKRRKINPDHVQVSPRMFYELARRYDEWPGEDYDGSSARGAMKGWQKHGVCAENDWPYLDEDDRTWNAQRLAAARARPLGAYFRVNHKDLIAMHSAIAEVGVLYATAMVHGGWHEVGASGVIPYREQVLGGHAFAIVAYDAFGLWIQNSWGTDWGADGFARISYDDWLANGTDVWVARLGAPVQLNEPASYATAHARTSGQSMAYSFVDLRPHLVSVGNNGKLRPGGDYGTTAAEIAQVFDREIPAFFDRSDKPNRLLLYAHGGLVGEEGAVQRVAEYRTALLDQGVYPLAFIWRSDYWTTIRNILQDAVRRRRPEGILDRSKDFLLDRLDDALEPVARYLSGKTAWDEMKENALLASQGGSAADIVLGHVAALRERYPDLEIHLIAHSAGAILMAPVVQRLCATGPVPDGAAQGLPGLGLGVASCTLWAPACNTALFKSAYAPAISDGTLSRFALYCLDDKTERDDDCAGLYHKSLLYLVSNAFEKAKRIPGFRQGEPLAGLHRSLEADPALSALLQHPGCELVVSPNEEPPGTLRSATARHHGDFDEDKPTVMSSLARILGTAPSDTAAMAGSTLHFTTSTKEIVSRRLSIDSKTK